MQYFFFKRLVVKEAADRTKFDAAREEISVLRFVLSNKVKPRNLELKLHCTHLVTKQVQAIKRIVHLLYRSGTVNSKSFVG